MDALSDYAFYQSGAVTKPVPANNHIEPFLEAKVPGLWTYYCVGQYKDVSNMFMAMPSARNRIPVSYTHLDVYKRQLYQRKGSGRQPAAYLLPGYTGDRRWRIPAYAGMLAAGMPKERGNLPRRSLFAGKPEGVSELLMRSVSHDQRNSPLTFIQLADPPVHWAGGIFP